MKLKAHWVFLLSIMSLMTSVDQFNFCWISTSNRHCLPTLHAAFMVFTVSVFPLTGVGDKVTSEPPNNSKTLYLDNKEGRHLVWDGFYTVMFVEVPTGWIRGCVGLYWVDLSAVSTVLFTSWHCNTSQLDTVEKKTLHYPIYCINTRCMRSQNTAGI